MNFPFPYHWMVPTIEVAGAVVDAVRLSGTNSWWRNAALSGAANGKKGILSVWYKLAVPAWDGFEMIMFGGNPDNIALRRAADNKLRLYFYDVTAATAAFDVKVSATSVADGKWHHFLASWDAAITSMQIYIDDLPVGVTNVVPRNNINIGYNHTNWIFGSDWNSTFPWAGELSEFYFNQATNLDLLDDANRRKFITASKRPVDLGSNGATPTGTAPIWYHSGSAPTAFRSNKGTGGAFTTGVTGTLQPPSNTPSTVYDPYTKLLWHCDGDPAASTLDFYDSAGPTGHIILSGNGAAIQVGSKKFGNAALNTISSASSFAYLDGSTDYAFGLGDFTIDFWMAFNPVGSYALMDFRYLTEGPYPSLWVETNKITYWVNGANRITGATVLAINTFYHVAVTRAAGSTRLFVNGVQQGSTYADSFNYLIAANRPTIGCDGSGLFVFNGVVDEIRILKGRAAWTSNFTPPTAPYVS